MPPLKLSVDAAYKVTFVLAVTVGAVQLKVQLWVELGEVCVISPFKTLVPVPAANVPAVAATSSPPLPAVSTLTESVYVLVVPDVTLVGPVRVMVGILVVLVLWQFLQVEPLMPDIPEMPPLLARAGTAAYTNANVTSAAHTTLM